MSITPQWKDELKARVTLSSVIKQTTKLQSAGREWKACCPFHNEKTPSFFVNDEKGFYHCFGCGEHGDVISWMIDQRGLQFIDAVKELAALAGMEVPRPDPAAAMLAESRATLVDVMKAAQKWFVDMLADTKGERAREYLRSRGFSPEIVREFGFGYAPDSKIGLRGALSNFDNALLVDAGMQISIENKAPYDRFRDRLMLPIQDQRGRVIAFGGRILEARDGVAKYLNSPDTPLFAKGRTLYNLHRAGPASRQTERMVVVEGYMDVIALANAGIADAVAPLGTALTEDQLRLLWHKVDTPVLCFDGDDAGQLAAMRAIGRALPMLQPEKSLKIVHLPSGLDPDDLIRQHGAGAMEKLLAESFSLPDALWTFERDIKKLRTPEDKAGLKARLLERIDTIQHPDIRALYRRDLLKRFSDFAFPPRHRTDWKSGSPATWRHTPRPSGETAARLRRSISGGARDNFGRAVLNGLLLHPGEISRHTEALGKLAELDPAMHETVERLLELSESLDSHERIAISNADGHPAPPDQYRYAFLREGTNPVDAREELAEAVALLVEKPALLSALEAAKRRFNDDPEGVFAEQTRLREQLATLTSRVREFGRRKAGAVTATEISRESDHETLPDMQTD